MDPLKAPSSRDTSRDQAQFGVLSSERARLCQRLNPTLIYCLLLSIGFWLMMTLDADQLESLQCWAFLLSRSLSLLQKILEDQGIDQKELQNLDLMWISDFAAVCCGAILKIAPKYFGTVEFQNLFNCFGLCNYLIIFPLLWEKF